MTKNQIPIFIVLLLIPVSTLSSQEKLWPEEVDAVIVLDENEFQVISEKRAKFKKHRIVQVYNEAGKRYGRVSVHENKFVRCIKISGKILDLNGNLIRKLRQEEIQKNPLFPRYVLYGDTKYQRFNLELSTFPYVVEYTYEQEYKSLFFWRGWASWFPQEDVPVLTSSYKLLINNKISYQTHAVGIEIEPRPTGKEGKSVLIWELENVKPRVKERYMPPEDEVQMALYFAPTKFKLGKYPGSFASWSEIAEWYSHLSSGRYSLPSEATGQVLNLITETDTGKHKVQKLYAFLQDYTRYVALELGVGGWQPYTAESTFKNRYGDCKDLSTFMIAMLKVVGIKAYPALVGTRDRGVLIKEFPSNQFNHCITFVPLQRDTLWLECTADLLAAGELPANVEGCDVLVVKENGGEIIRTPQSQFDDNLWLSKIEGSLTPSGGFKFTGEITSDGNGSSYLRSNLNGRNPEDRKQWLAGLLGRYLPKLDLIEHEIDHLNQDIEEPIIVRFKGAVRKFGVRSAKRLFINPNILNRETASDVPREQERKFPIHYRYAFMDVDSLSILIPEGFELEAAPKPEEIKTAFGYFRTSYSFSDGKLTYDRIFRQERTHVPLSEYKEYLSFLKRVVKNDKSQFVFRRI